MGPVTSWHEGDVCHKLRKLCGLTAKELAALARVTPSAIYRLEDGKTKEPKRATVAKLARAFGLTTAEFLECVPRGGVPIPRIEPAAPTDEQRRRRA